MKRLRHSLIYFFCCFSLLWGNGPSRDETVSRITGNLMCMCSCPHVIRHCGDECGVAPQLVQQITELVSSGKTEGDVYGIFEEKFGPSVHAVPKAEGFNLLAWILPFVGLAAGAVVVVVVFRHLKPEVSSEKVGSIPEIDKKYRKLLDRELRS